MKRLKHLYNISTLPWIVIFSGILLSSLIAWKSMEWITKAEYVRFVTASDQIIFLVQKTLEVEVQLLESTVAFMNATDNVTARKWEIFAEKHAFFERLPGVEALAYAPSTSEGFVVKYLEPLTENNQKAMGYNMSTSLVRKSAIEQAIQSGKVTFSSKIDLVQETDVDEKPGFLIFAPLYQKGTTPQTPQERMDTSKGVVLLGIKSKKLFGELLSAKYIIVDFEIYDGNTPREAFKLYDSNPKLTLPRLERYVVFEMYGKKWTMYFKANEALDMDLNRYIPHTQIFFGFLLSFVLGSWIYALQHTRKAAYRIAEEKTQQLLTSEAEMRTIFQVMQEGIIVQNAQGVIIECNLAAQEILGISADNIKGRTSADTQWQAIHEDGTPFELKDRPAVKVFSTKKAQENIVMGINRLDGSTVWVYVNAQPIFADDFEEVVSVVITLNDITALKKSKHQLEAYVEIIDSNIITSSTDINGIITEVSAAFCKISGYSKEELIGKNHRIVRHPDMPNTLYEEMWKTLRAGRSWAGEIKNRSKDGASYWVDAVISPRHNEQGEIIGYTAVRQDITDKKRIEELSIRDRLTGLYNRLKLDELFALHLSLVRRHGGSFSVIMLDIDKFKLVNDVYGHQVGDTVLQEISLLMRENIRFEDALGRWGGEEFLILLPTSTLQEAVALAEHLRERTEQFPFSVVGTKTISLGVATFHQGDDEKSMVSRADEALYRAKRNGRNRVEIETNKVN